MADTQAMSSLVKALTGALPDTALRQLTQALGNCVQPTTSRSPQNFQPNEWLGNLNGVYGPGKWDPSQYPGLLPTAGSRGYKDIAGGGGWTGGSYTGGDWNVSNYGGNSFSFPTNQAFNLNNFYGGSTFNVGGNSVFNNITTNQITVTGGGGGFSPGGGGGGGVPTGGEQPTSPALPGDGGGAGGGQAGGGGGFGGPIIINGGGVGPQSTGRMINLRASGRVNIPSEGELTEDCKVRLIGSKQVTVQVQISPTNFRAMG